MSEYKEYARALFSIYFEDADIYDELCEIYNILTENNLYIKVMDSAGIKTTDKLYALERAFSPFSDYIKNFLKLLVQRRAFYTIFDCIEYFKELCELSRGRIYVKITSAVELSSDEKRRLMAALSKRCNKQFIPYFFVDRSILGGVRISFLDKLYDYSLRTKLNQLSHALLREELG